MLTLAFADVAMDVEIKFTTQNCLIGDSRVARVIELLHALRANVDLDTFKFERDSGDVYDYQFTHKDGRKWRQKIDFSYNGPTDPGQSFNTHGDFWLLSEFEHHRLLRDAVIALHNWRAVDKIEVRFT